MPARHNAALHIKYGPTKTFHLFLSGFGHPEQMRQLIKLSFRSRRRQIMLDPELAVVNIFRLASHKTQVYINRREDQFAFTYHINLIPNVPTIRVISHISGNDQTVNLFPFLGPDYRISKNPTKLKTTSGISHNRPGRPSRLSKLFTKSPLYIKPDGTPVYDK